MIDVLVIGNSLAALRAALDCAELGLQVRIVDAELAAVHDAQVAAGFDQPAPSSAQGENGANRADTTPQRDSAGSITALIEQVAQPLTGLGHRPANAPVEATRICTAPLISPLLRARSGAWAPQNEPNLWGIPSVPLAETTIALIGTGAALRAHRDRIAPILTIGKSQTLGPLVAKRIGRTAHDTLVAPQLWEQFGVAPDQIDVAIAAPGLNETMTRVGSLTGAVLAYADRHSRQEESVAPEQGWGAFTAALIERLSMFAVEFSGSVVESAVQNDSEIWTTQLTDGTEVSARAMVIDEAFIPSVPGIREICADLDPVMKRIHAEIDIDLDIELEPSQEVLQQLGDWTLRSDSSGRACVVGPRQSKTDLEQVVDHSSVVLEVLKQSSFERSEGFEVRASIISAPFATVAERDSANARLARVVSAHPALLPVGEGLFGGDLSASIAAANQSAIMLRRRLLGIVDG